VIFFYESFALVVKNSSRMKSIARINIRCITLVLINWSLVAQTFGTNIDWRLIKDVSCLDPPIDVVTSLDGSHIFILTANAVLVYARTADKIVNRIPASKAFDNLSYSGTKNELILRSTTSKVLRIIKIYPIFRINTGGLPFMGPPNAPVTVVVFDDYKCGACAVLDKILNEVLQIFPEEVKLVIKSFPNSNHHFAAEAAVAARAAR